jgi:hypothetical protein
MSNTPAELTRRTVGPALAEVQQPDSLTYLVLQVDRFILV